MANRSCFQGHFEITVKIARNTSTYPIILGHGLLSDKSLLPAFIQSPQIFIVTNTTVAPFYLSAVLQLFPAKDIDVFILEDGEQYKNETSLFAIQRALIEKKHHRNTTILGLGGGVVGDIAAFAASIYQRGVDYIALPTTLLAQVDAAIGGKTGINFLNGKNMVGSFYQPKAVFIDIDALRTLPLRELRSGFAEIIKYAVLIGGPFMEKVQGLLAYGLSHENLVQYKAQWAEIIYECCSIKASLVEQDEEDNGKRKLLNLGHTLGHALEACTDYERWSHGEAVAIGLCFAAWLSQHYFELNGNDFTLIKKALLLAQLPVGLPKDIPIEAIYHSMLKDKKAEKGCLHFIVIRQIGDCYCQALDKEINVLALLSDYQSQYSG